MLDYVPAVSHPHIRRVLEVTKQRFKGNTITAQQLPRLTKKHQVYSFEALNDELDQLLTGHRVQLLPPLWFATPEAVREWFKARVREMSGNGRTRTNLQAFYRQQVLSLGIPARFKESTDSQNRSSLPLDSEVSEANQLRLPLTPKEAQYALSVFIETRFRSFAKYQDAVAPEHGLVLFHSCLSAAFNTGLLLPQQVAEAVI